ncbi:DUF4365 domain-containing protein [Sorangium sp. KYC3313]|uniref:DUF4365 domain-containing protein n=1 Tax=Sorangium sp. KYC3313 TaxID=3449740 RepID=UPI003F894D34
MDPKGTSRRTGPLFSPEMRTSQRAVFQLADRLTEAGWKVDSSSIYPDTGEDVRVEIFETGGACTGLSLDLQVKGHKSIERFHVESDPAHLHYPLDVKHLVGWEKKTRPVAIIVWDIRERCGYWALARDACELLDKDKRSRGWRGQQEATLLIPRANVTDDEGLTRLRAAVARDELPKLVRPDEEVAFELSLQLDDSPEGRAKVDELTRFWEGGGAVAIESRFISDLDMRHDGLRAAFGEDYWKRSTEVQLFSVPGREFAPVRVEAESPAGTAQLPYIELRLVRSGHRYRTLSNEHQRAAVTLTLTMSDEDAQHAEVSLELALNGRDVVEATAAVWFVLVATEPGGNLRLERLDKKTDACLVPFRVSVPEEERSALRRVHELLERLCWLQGRVRRHGNFKFIFPPPKQQLERARKLLRVVAGGEHEIEMMYTANIRAKGARTLVIDAAEGPATFVVDGKIDNEDTIEIFGVRVPIGPVRCVIADVPRFVEAYNSALQQALASQQATFQVKILCRGRYLHWIPEGSVEDRLDALAKEQSGYFTADQAGSVGCFADYLDYLEQRQKVQTVAEGVYRMVNFPPVSDVEDLVVVWLQSGKTAVFSHHTALVLHALSDILPPRIHATVPPDWTPAASLPDHVVLHRATLAESDVSWHDVVPVTTPIRTLRDCTDAGLDPDLLDQAYREGIERGMFSADELPPSTTFAAE